MKLSRSLLVSSFCLLAAAYALGRTNQGDHGDEGAGSQGNSHANPPAARPTTPPAPPAAPPGNPDAATHSNLPAPCDVTACVDSGGNLNVAWTTVPGATKYAIEVEASYDEGLGGGCGEATEDFDFGTDGSSIEIPLSAFDFDFGDPVGVVSPCSLDVKVKGLNPPQKRGGRQNNPFTGADQNPIDPTAVTCPDVDTPIPTNCV